MIRIVLVDDDPLVTQSLQTIIEAQPDCTVLAIGRNQADALRLYQDIQPDILLMDIQMGDSNGLKAAADLLTLVPHAQILLLTTFLDDEYIVEAVRLGVKGYLLKQDVAAIVPALRAVSQGQSVYGNDISVRLPELLQQQPKTDFTRFALSEKELALLELVAQGLNNKEIAAQMFFSEGTVRNYISHLLEKLDLRDRTQLAVFFYQKGQ